VEVGGGEGGAAADVISLSSSSSGSVKKNRVKRKKSPSVMGYFLTDMISSVIKDELIRHISPSATAKKKSKS
jgi:hypothetical protein